MKAAITGASGHIGNCLLRELIKQGVSVKILVRELKHETEYQGCIQIKGNVLDSESLMELCKEVDVVFHLAAQIALDNRKRKHVYETNVTGTKNMLQAAMKTGVTKFIHFSSIHAFQSQTKNKLLNERCPLTNSKKSVYEHSKADSERLVSKARKEGLNTVILCPTAVIGPYDFKGSFLGQALRRIYKNKLPALVNGGYNWVDVRDVAQAAIQLIKNGNSGEKYILAGHYCELKELSKIIGEISGKKTPTIVVPIFLARLVAPIVALCSLITKDTPLYTSQSLDIIQNSPKHISHKKAEIELYYRPRPLQQTLKDTFNWFKEHKHIT